MTFWTKLFRGGKTDEYQHGIELFNSGDYDGAIEVLERVIAESRSTDYGFVKHFLSK